MGCQKIDNVNVYRYDYSRCVLEVYENVNVNLISYIDGTYAIKFKAWSKKNASNFVSKEYTCMLLNEYSVTSKSITMWSGSDKLQEFKQTARKLILNKRKEQMDGYAKKICELRSKLNKDLFVLK